MKVSAAFAAAFCSMLWGIDAQSHHGFFGVYSLDERIDFSGTVVAVEWVNPHAFVSVRAEVEGAETVFRIELQGLRQLRNKGWRGDELALGETVRVVNAALGLEGDSTLVCCARIYDLNGKEFFTDPRPGQPATESDAASGVSVSSGPK